MTDRVIPEPYCFLMAAAVSYSARAGIGCTCDVCTEGRHAATAALTAGAPLTDEDALQIATDINAIWYVEPLAVRRMAVAAPLRLLGYVPGLRDEDREIVRAAVAAVNAPIDDEMIDRLYLPISFTQAQIISRVMYAAARLMLNRDPHHEQAHAWASLGGRIVQPERDKGAEAVRIALLNKEATATLARLRDTGHTLPGLSAAHAAALREAAQYAAKLSHTDPTQHHITAEALPALRAALAAAPDVPADHRAELNRFLDTLAAQLPGRPQSLTA